MHHISIRQVVKETWDSRQLPAVPSRSATCSIGGTRLIYNLSIKESRITFGIFCSSVCKNSTVQSGLKRFYHQRWSAARLWLNVRMRKEIWLRNRAGKDLSNVRRIIFSSRCLNQAGLRATAIYVEVPHWDSCRGQTEYEPSRSFWYKFWRSGTYESHLDSIDKSNKPLPEIV
jgi:hypothetical protein